MIINSLLDTDLYKFTMGQVALHQFPWVNVEYAFKCRNTADFSIDQIAQIHHEIKHLCSLKFTKEELEYLKQLDFIKDSYIDFLSLYQPNINHIKIELVNDELSIRVKGPWFLTIYFEVPVLAIVNEVYFRNTYPQYFMDEQLYSKAKMGAHLTLDKKIKVNQEIPFKFADFGTRRRFCREWQREVIETLKKHCPNFVGTSNVLFAKEFNLKPIGTMAHEFFQVGQALDVPLVESQKRMLQSWVDEYRGDLGIALTDIVGFNAFLKDFDLYFAKLYDGLRHDSGDPFVWAEKAIDHYKKLGIDPKTKTLVFSDGLNFELASRLHQAFSDVTNVSFGIGTNLTNDFVGITPLQIVMKLVKVNNKPVAKISDSPGKGMCEDEEFVGYLKKVFNIMR